MLFASTKFDTLVESVARQIRARFPPVIANDPERAASQERIEEIVDETFAAALQSGGDGRTGFVGKTLLRNALRRELREIGYDEKFVNFAIEKFMAQLTRGAR